MALQLLRQVFSIAKRYVGLPAELTVDESNWDLLLHDGATPGGRRVLNQDNADERYQARSPELDGLLGFEPQQKGILVRRGPKDYRVRRIEVNTDSLKGSNLDGYSGNPKLGLADTVKSAHTWDGNQTFSKEIVAKGGLQGDVTGDVTGDLTGDSAGKHTGSVDTSGGTLTLADGQIKLAALEALILERLCPIGSILIWSGAANAIPKGWSLCNGQNGTPDLTNRFVVGAGATLAVGDSGGDDPLRPAITVENATVGVGDIKILETILTVEQMPKHRHGSGVTDSGESKVFVHGTQPVNPRAQDSIKNEANGGTYESLTEYIGGSAGHTHEVEVGSAAGHTHTATIESFEAIPPYYALCYIMKKDK